MDSWGQAHWSVVSVEQQVFSNISVGEIVAQVLIKVEVELVGAKKVGENIAIHVVTLTGLCATASLGTQKNLMKQVGEDLTWGQLIGMKAQMN